MNNFECKIIGQIHTPFADKFAVPRQALLAKNIVSTIELFKPYDSANAFIGLDGFSHLYVLFVFDKIEEQADFRAMVRPPRLGGNQKLGVFATRSPFRPSRIGLSIVKLDKIVIDRGSAKLLVLGADMVDKTPIIDIKPYIPFVDCKIDAKGGFANTDLDYKQVEYIDSLKDHILTKDEIMWSNLQSILACDPRPAYRAGTCDDKLYCARLYGHKIFFKFMFDKVIVVDIQKDGD